MRNISLIAFLLIVSFISGADAVSKSDGEKYKTEWGVGDAGNYTCLGTASDYGIGTSETGTDRAWHKYLNYYFMYDGTHAKGAAYYIAREMTEHGYKFCKTLLGGGRGWRALHGGDDHVLPFEKRGLFQGVGHRSCHGRHCQYPA